MQTIRHQTAIRSQLVRQAEKEMPDPYKDLAKAALRAELIFVVIVACVIAVFWSMP